MVERRMMRRGQKFIVAYFLLFGALTIVAIVPGGALMVMLMTAMALPLFGIPGLVVVASPTILLYSATLIPLWLALTAREREAWRVAAAALVPFAVAALPGLLSQQDAGEFETRASQNDVSRQAVAKPRTIELIGDGRSGLFDLAQRTGDKNAPCNEICRRLLFNGEADWVRMTRLPELGASKRSDMLHSVTYRIEHRQACPQFGDNSAKIEKAVRDRLIAGDCVIAEPGGSAAADATLRLTTRHSNRPRARSKAPTDLPRNAFIETVKELRIESRQDGAGAPLVLQTETVARTLALPFYIGIEMNMQGGYNGPTIGRTRTVAKPIDAAQALRTTFGYALAAIAAPPPDDPRRIAEGILALPSESHAAFSAQQQDALNDVLTAMVKQPALSEADLGFLRRVIADRRVTEARLGTTLQQLFRKHPGRLESLIAVLLDRISVPVLERVGHYQSQLGWSLGHFPAGSLRPYRDQMLAVVEAQPEWPSYGVLTRLAEIGGDGTVDLVIRRLNSKAARFAAVAACRASDEAWRELEPAVLAHLRRPRRGDRLQDDEGPLLLALIRFGKTPLAIEMIEQRGLAHPDRVLKRLSRFEPGFDPERCRSSL